MGGSALGAQHLWLESGSQKGKALQAEPMLHRRQPLQPCICREMPRMPTYRPVRGMIMYVTWPTGGGAGKPQKLIKEIRIKSRLPERYQEKVGLNSKLNLTWFGLARSSCSLAGLGPKIQLVA